MFFLCCYFFVSVSCGDNDIFFLSLFTFTLCDYFFALGNPKFFVEAFKSVLYAVLSEFEVVRVRELLYH